MEKKLLFGPDFDNRVKGEILLKLNRDGELQVTESIPSGPIRRIAGIVPNRFGFKTLDRVIGKLKIKSITKVHGPISHLTTYRAGDFVVTESLPGIMSERSPESPVTRISGELGATYRLRLDEETDLSKAVNELSRIDEVADASPNYFRFSSVTPNDPMYVNQWGLVKINCPDAWDRTKGSTSVIVAVVDTGVDLDHPDMITNLVPGYDCVDLVGVSPEPGWHFEGDFLTRDNNPQDEVGHGTHVAGTISVLTNNTRGVSGVTWVCKILPVKVLARMVHNTYGWVTGVGTATDISAGIKYAADHGANIINLSLGGYHDTFVERDAVAYAISKGCVVVAAMGNDDVNTPHYPAAYPDVVAVGAINQAEQRVSMLNTGGVWGSNTGSHIDVVAPGVDIRSTDWDDTYSDKSGTSMATPHVSGVAALIKSCNMTLTASQITQIIRDTAKALKDASSDPVPNERYGHGLVDAKSALNKACPELPEIEKEAAYQYAVKFVCGKASGDVLAPGEYWTAINVHNPTANSVKFRKKIAIALPNERAGPVTKYFHAMLGPDEALEIDRKDIFEHAKQRFDFLKGFVIIKSDVELDVVAVYTATGSQRQVDTMFMERVIPRRQKIGKPDLVPVPDEYGYFCKIKDDMLIVTVKNQGSVEAGPSTTKVDFGRYGVLTKQTPSLAPGKSVDLSFKIPTGCFDSDCEFIITVDANNNVDESDEGNNTGSGCCIG